MINFNPKDRYGFEDLVEIMAILRSPEGCPWDREQTHESIRNNFLEEVYEAVDAIDHKDTANLREELGDVMMQVVFHAQIAREEGLFELEDVLDEVCQKLIRRHPHIFGTVSANTSQEVLKNWDAIKRQEKGQNSVSDTLRQVPTALPDVCTEASEPGQKRRPFPGVHPKPHGGDGAGDAAAGEGRANGAGPGPAFVCGGPSGRRAGTFRRRSADI